jgi:membrane protein
VLITSIIVAIQQLTESINPTALQSSSSLRIITSFFWQLVFAAVSICVTITLFVVVYRFMPNANVSVSDTMPGAVAGGLLWELAKYVFAWSLQYFHYDQVYGSVGAVVAVLTWSYVSSLILLFGAQLTAVFHREHPMVKPAMSSTTEVAASVP